MNSANTLRRKTLYGTAAIEPTSSALYAAVLAMICLCVGLFVWQGESAQLRTAIDSKSWPTTAAKITHAEVMHHASRYGSYYKPLMMYEYTVNGTTYDGEAVSLETEGNHFSWFGQFAQMVVDRFPEGAFRSCSYNPVNPKQAILIPGVDPRHVAYTAFGWLAFGIAMLGFSVVSQLCAVGVIKDPHSQHFNYSALAALIIGIVVYSTQPLVIGAVVPPSALAVVQK